MKEALAETTPRSGPGPRDIVGSVGALFMLTRDGKLDAIDALRIGGRAPKLERAGLNLSILSPLVCGVHRSNLCVVVDGGERGHAQFMMQVGSGQSARRINAVGSKAEIISRALDDETLPIVVEAELAECVARFQAGTSPDRSLCVPLRSLEIRKHLPRELIQELRELALENARAEAPKAQVLKRVLQRLRAGLRRLVLCDYMMKCLWLDLRSGQLGNVTDSSAGVEFVPFDVDEDEVRDFLCALEKDPYGEFVLDFREFAKVLPTPRRSNPWLGPTVHVYKADFRAEHGLEEYYSLYEGFRALSSIGPPVLVFRGQNPLVEESNVRFLKITDRSINLLQGRLLEGSALQEGVRRFTAQALVWTE